MNLRDQAIKLARSGFHVFPLGVNSKRPRFEGWQQQASSDPEVVARLWSGPNDEPLSYNIGIATGDGVNGSDGALIVLDVDNKENRPGDESLEKLEMLNDLLPNTFVVKTPTGGFHHYFVGEGVANSVGKVGEALDIRSVGGYVVAPGSVLDIGEYKTITRKHPAPCPEWLWRLANENSMKDEAKVEVDVEADKPAAIMRAIQYLDKEAPIAIEGNGGDATTYYVAARVKDFGISELTAFEMLLDHWNEKCAPPWLPDELKAKVNNAYRYGHRNLGHDSPEADFKPIPQNGEAKVSSLAATPVEPFKLDAIPPRRWILDTLAMGSMLTVLIAPPGVGKSTGMMAAALSVATGKEFMGWKVHEQGAVWVFNNEDDSDELRRRLAALMQYHQIRFEDFADRLFMDSGTDRPLKIAKRDRTGQLRRYDVDAIKQQIVEREIAVMVVDPFLETHDANENSNEEINFVARLYREIAHDTGCAIILVHHTRKPAQGGSDGHVGSMDAGRGASSLMGVARIAKTLFGMSQKDAKKYGVAEHDRRLYIRLDDAKANVALISGKETWFKRVSVTLYNGDDVGALEPVDLTPIEDDPNLKIMQDVLNIIGTEPMPMVEVCETMVNELPMYKGTNAESLRKRLTRILEEPALLGDWVVKIGTNAQHSRRKLLIPVYRGPDKAVQTMT